MIDDPYLIKQLLDPHERRLGGQHRLRSFGNPRTRSPPPLNPFRTLILRVLEERPLAVAICPVAVKAAGAIDRG